VPRPHFFRTEKEDEGPAGMEGMGKSKSAESAQEGRGQGTATEGLTQPLRTQQKLTRTY